MGLLLQETIIAVEFVQNIYRNEYDLHVKEGTQVLAQRPHVFIEPHYVNGSTEVRHTPVLLNSMHLNGLTLLELHKSLQRVISFASVQAHVYVRTNTHTFMNNV